MLKKRNHLPAYPDGVVQIVEEKENQTSFGAKKNPTTRDDLKKIVSLFYAIENIREKDFEYAEQLGSTLTLKLRCPLAPGITSTQKALIGKMLYDISHTDSTTREIFIYLSGGRKIADS